MNSNYIYQLRATILGFLMTVPRGIASAAVLAFIVSGAAQASITYDLVTLSNGSGDTLTGSITTNGTIGTLSTADITGFSFTQTGSAPFSYGGTTNLGCDVANGCGITATATSLSFAFTNPTQDIWIEFCTSGSYPCVEFGDAYFFGDIYGNVIGVKSSTFPVEADDYGQPSNPIATAVPVPAAAWLFGSALGLGLLGLRKRKQIA